VSCQVGGSRVELVFSLMPPPDTARPPALPPTMIDFVVRSPLGHCAWPLFRDRLAHLSREVAAKLDSLVGPRVRARGPAATGNLWGPAPVHQLAFRYPTSAPRAQRFRDLVHRSRKPVSINVPLI